MFVERDTFLNDLTALAASIARGRGAIALVSGEAGIGKTTLMDAFRSSVSASHKLYFGGCDALFTPRPLGPLHDMAPVLGGETARLLGGGGHTADLYAAVAKQLGESAKPAVMIIEDTHWADHATLDFLKYLGRRISMVRVLLIMTYRDDETGPDHPLTQVIGELPATYTHRIRLDPLSLEGVAQLAKDAGSDYAAQSLFEATGGNPFFVTELLANTGGDPGAIPASVKDAVGARLIRLTDAERDFLETISVIPGSTPTGILPQLIGPEGETLAMAAIGRGLLVKDGADAVRFRHELARLSTLQRLATPRQKDIHARVLTALEATDDAPSFDRLVHHAAGSQNADKVLQYAPKAATRAAALGAHREAAAHLATALKFVDRATPEAAAGIYEQWAYESALTGAIDDDVLDARRHAVTLWRALGRTDKVGENLRWLSRAHWYRGEAAEATRFAEEAVKTLESIPASSERAMAYSLRSQLHMLNDQMAESIDWGERAIALADEFGDIEVRAHALNNIGAAKLFRGNRDGVAAMEESLALSLENGFHEHAARVYTNLSEYAVEFREFDLAERVLTEGIAFDTQYDLDTWTHYIVGRQAQLRLDQGRLRDAETIAEGVIGVDALTLLVKLPALTTLAKTRMRLDADDAPALLAEALDNAMATDELQYMTPLRIAFLEKAWLANDPGAAREHFQWLFATGADAMHTWRVGEVAVWAARLGVAAPNAFLAELPAPHIAEIDGRVEDAAALWLDIGAPYEAALALVSTVAAPSAARLAEAMKLLIPIEAHAGVGRVDDIARALGVAAEMPRRRRGPYKAARNHPLGLTKKEQAILAHIVAGASNAEIAQALSRSQRTIEHHVSSILTKLGVPNRMEAMLRVRNEPWLAPRE